MVNIISKNGMFFKGIPFNLENARALQNDCLRGFCVLEAPNLREDARILATDLKNGSKPIAIAVMKNECENVVQSDEHGFSCLTGRFRIYVPTRVSAYENFVPSLYQACLIRNAGHKLNSWIVAVCNGYLENGYPAFFELMDTGNYECVPLCKATLPLRGLSNISWQEYIQSRLRNDED